MGKHLFTGKWITDSEFYNLEPRNVFHRQKDKTELAEEHLNAHILFRDIFNYEKKQGRVTIFISADDYYKLYINGSFVAMGPAPSYHIYYNYNEIDITPYLMEGENLIAVHTLYQGLINRVWQSGDFRHGLIFDIMAGDTLLLASSERTLTRRHSGYSIMGRVGYDTQFMERYDSNSPEDDFSRLFFDDTRWENAKPSLTADHALVPQASKPVVTEEIRPVSSKMENGVLFLDFGAIYVGYLCLAAQGKKGDTLTIKCAQELNDDGSIRYKLRANCDYLEEWILSGSDNDRLDQFDYKSFRYATVEMPEGVEIQDAYLLARHYPYTQARELRPEYRSDERLRAIWHLATNSQRYGVQETIMDCMEREKGFYVGDGCYTALAHAILTGDDSIARKLIDDGFRSTFITGSMMTCLDCSFMQEIAEYPLMLVFFILWHYRLFGDKAYLAENYVKAKNLLEVYRKDYERKDGLIGEMDKWAVVEWPANYRDGYDVDISQANNCTAVHIAICAYYIEAIHTLNRIAEELHLPAYRDEGPLRASFNRAFYVPEKHLFRDAIGTEHISIVGNIFAYAFRLAEDDSFYPEMERWIEERGINAVSMFTSFPMMIGLVRGRREDLILRQLLDEGAWLRILREDSTTSFEGWGKECKWNTSLFHMTMSDVAVFLAEGVDLDALFKW
ncbi:MAG: family 78 glycoside hydrolase catalytic domain [Clostridia bacterium]|nr:family 78 glycoside hydrolase catalytic domain [Clostridia bacterium]